MCPSPHRCCTRDSRTRWGVSLSSLNMCFEVLAYFFPTIPSALKEMVWWLVMHLTLSRSLGISHQMFSLFFYFPRSWKGQGTKIKAYAEKFHVHSSPLIYWKFQHLNRRKKAKSTGILAGWRVIKKRWEFPQNKHTKARLLHTVSSPVILWLHWHACQEIKGRKPGERHKALSLELHTDSGSKGRQAGLPPATCTREEGHYTHEIYPGSIKTTGSGQMYLEWRWIQGKVMLFSLQTSFPAFLCTMY